MRWCSRCCTARPGRTARCARCWPCSSVPFVGSVGSACRVAFDKSDRHDRGGRAGVRTPQQVALPHEIFRELGAAALVSALGDQIGFPMMVKPTRGGSALGCSKVSRAAELPAAMVGAYAYGPVAVVEEFIAGTEIAVAVVDRGSGPEALPGVEIRPDSGVYDYTARYTAGATRFLCPAEVDPAVAARCAEMALRVHEVLGLRDVSRTDLIVTAGRRAGLLGGERVARDDRDVVGAAGHRGRRLESGQDVRRSGADGRGQVGTAAGAHRLGHEPAARAPGDRPRPGAGRRDDRGRGVAAGGLPAAGCAGRGRAGCRAAGPAGGGGPGWTAGPRRVRAYGQPSQGSYEPATRSWSRCPTGRTRTGWSPCSGRRTGARWPWSGG